MTADSINEADPMTQTRPPNIPDTIESSDRSVRLRDLHRDFYVELVQQAEVEVRGPNQKSWWDTLDAEYDNLRLALEWCLDHADAEGALRLAIALSEIWMFRGDPRPADDWLERASLLAGDAHKALRSRALVRRSHCAAYAGDQQGAFAAVEQALALARESGDDRAIFTALQRLGHRDFGTRIPGGTQGARVVQEETLRLARDLGDELLIADALFQQWAAGISAARASREEALALYRKVGDLEYIAWVVYDKGWEFEDEHAERACAQEALELGRQLGNDTLVSCVIELVGYLEMYAGNYHEALAVYREAIDEFRMPGRRWHVPWIESWMLAEQADLEFEMGDVAAVRRHAEEALEICVKNRYPEDGVWPRTHLACLLMVEGHADQARAAVAEAVAHARDCARPHGVMNALRAEGRIALADGDYPGARAAFREAHSMTQAMAQPWRGAEFARFLGEVEISAGDHAAAEEWLVESVRLCRETGPTWSCLELLSQLALARLARARGELENASALYSAAISALHQRRHGPYLAHSLESACEFAAETERFELAATLCGTAEAIRLETRTRVHPFDRDRHDGVVATIKDTLGAEAFQAACSEGRAMDRDAAVEYALDHI